MQITLHALPDDFSLRASGDVERDSVTEFPFVYYLTDPQGNKLTDPQGNYLTGIESQVFYPQQLYALPDDFNLRSE